MQKKIFRYLIIFLLLLLVLQTFGKSKPNTSGEDFALTSRSKFSIGKVVTLKVQNQTDKNVTLKSVCPKNPLKIEKYKNGEWILVEANSEKCDKKPIVIPAKGKITINYAPWNKQLFKEIGRYRAILTIKNGKKEHNYTREFKISTPGVLSRTFKNIFYRPIYNTLIYFVSVIPNHSLGWAIILLTFLIKLALLGPNHKALKAQKRMQKIQPQLDALKEKYKNDQPRLAQESMKLWKQYKVNPMDSCLPMLIQFPILIALFYVVKNGLTTADPNLFYGSLKSFDMSTVNTQFYNLFDLTKTSAIVLPVIVGGLQFVQMKLTFAKAKKKTDKVISGSMMNKMMQYTMPILIAVFTASMPAAVGFYWGTSTLFGIGQQYFVNKSKD